MGAVPGFKTARTCTSTCLCRCKVSSCIPSMGYLESLTDCSTIAQIRNLDMWTLALNLPEIEKCQMMETSFKHATNMTD